MSKYDQYTYVYLSLSHLNPSIYSHPFRPSQQQNKQTPTQTNIADNEDDHGDSEIPPPKETRIINGEKVTDNRYPYFTLQNEEARCGAVLIGSRFVLTAAHCVGSVTQNFLVGARTSVNDGRKVPYVDFAVHPKSNPDLYSHDIALFYLQEEVNDIPYIKLSRDVIDTTGFLMTVIGFGDTNGQDFSRLQLSDHLREVEVAYLPNDVCDRMHGGLGEVQPDMLCAGGDGKDACYGDSGGPLIVPGADISQDKLVGIVSWGRGCADTRFPGVYTRMSFFYDWVAEMACVRDFESAPEYMDCSTVLGLEEAVVPSPTPSPIRTPPASEGCIARGQLCVPGFECCPGYRCRSEICAPSGEGEKKKLSDVFGSSVGGAVRRRYAPAPDDMFLP